MLISHKHRSVLLYAPRGPYTHSASREAHAAACFLGVARRPWGPTHVAARTQPTLPGVKRGPCVPPLPTSEPIGPHTDCAGAEAADDLEPQVRGEPWSQSGGEQARASARSALCKAHHVPQPALTALLTTPALPHCSCCSGAVLDAARPPRLLRQATGRRRPAGGGSDGATADAMDAIPTA